MTTQDVTTQDVITQAEAAPDAATTMGESRAAKRRRTASRRWARVRAGACIAVLVGLVGAGVVLTSRETSAPAPTTVSTEQSGFRVSVPAAWRVRRSRHVHARLPGAARDGLPCPGSVLRRGRQLLPGHEVTGRKARRAAASASLVVVSVVALVAAALLYRVQSNAVDIQAKTGRIAESARGINVYTDAIIRLNDTNALAASILDSVDPLGDPVAAIRAQSADIAELMRSIKGSTASINTSTRSIDPSSGEIRDGLAKVESSTASIKATVGEVNVDAARILQVLGLIQRGVALIGSDLEATAAIVAAILADAGRISGAVVTTDHLASCIDNGLNGDADCIRVPRP